MAARIGGRDSAAVDETEAATFFSGFTESLPSKDESHVQPGRCGHTLAPLESLVSAGIGKPGGLLVRHRDRPCFDLKISARV